MKKNTNNYKVIPNLYIIGVYKGGTTSLHNYLIKHPLIDQGKQKETHYLDKFVYQELSSDRVSPEEYAKMFKKSNCEYLLESSPSYLYGSKELIKFIKSYSSSPRIILLLRNPKDRFISYYRYLHSKDIIKDDFKSFVKNCRKNYNYEDPLQKGIYQNALKEGLYINYLKNWMEEFSNNLMILFTEDLKNDPQHEMDKIFSFLNLDPIIYSKQDFILANKTINPKSKFIHNSLSSLNLRRIIHPKVYNKLIQIYRRINSQKEIKITQKETILLDDFYNVPNRKLFEYLKRSPKW